MNPEPMIGEEDVARGVRRNRFVRTRRIASFDETVPPTEEELDDARAAISAHLEALERAGWRCVPIKATAAMCKAGEDHQTDELGDPCPMQAHSVWREMISAAPPQNSNEVKP